MKKNRRILLLSCFLFSSLTSSQLLRASELSTEDHYDANQELKLESFTDLDLDLKSMTTSQGAFGESSENIFDIMISTVVFQILEPGYKNKNLDSVIRTLNDVNKTQSGVPIALLASSENPSKMNTLDENEKAYSDLVDILVDLPLVFKYFDQSINSLDDTIIKTGGLYDFVTKSYIVAKAFKKSSKSENLIKLREQYVPRNIFEDTESDSMDKIFKSIERMYFEKIARNSDENSELSIEASSVISGETEEEFSVVDLKKNAEIYLKFVFLYHKVLALKAVESKKMQEIKHVINQKIRKDLSHETVLRVLKLLNFPEYEGETPWLSDVSEKLENLVLRYKK